MSHKFVISLPCSEILENQILKAQGSHNLTQNKTMLETAAKLII